MTTSRVVDDLPRVERQPDGRRVLVRPLRVDLGVRISELDGAEGVSETDAGTTLITIPAGFDTDYSTIPLLGRLFMGRWDKHDLAGIVHDYLYRIGAERGAADRAWRIVARSGMRRVNAVQGFLGWVGLRLGGGWVYARRRRDDPGPG